MRNTPWLGANTMLSLGFLCIAVTARAMAFSGYGNFHEATVESANGEYVLAVTGDWPPHGFFYRDCALSLTVSMV